MNVPVTVNGVTVEIPVDDEVIQKAFREKQKETGYEKVISGDNFYLAGPSSTKVCTETNYNTMSDIGSFDVANYYSDKNVAKNNIRADTLMRQLRRFAAEHGGFPVDKNQVKWQILCEYRTDTLKHKMYVSSSGRIRRFGSIYFATEEAANRAIEEFHDELMWYFTEYDPMPSGWWDN